MNGNPLLIYNLTGTLYADALHFGYKNTVGVDFSVEGHVNGLEITPLILIPFVENIFKHGVIELKQKPFIHICIQNNYLKLFTGNKVKKQQKDKTGGIGLTNVKRRLQLLYPGKHSFYVKKEADEFSCSLEIDLS